MSKKTNTQNSFAEFMVELRRRNTRKQPKPLLSLAQRWEMTGKPSAHSKDAQPA